MQYLVENRNKFILYYFPITVFLFLAGIFFLLEDDAHINLYFVLYLLIPIPIYIFFTKKFKNYYLSSMIFMALFGLIMHTVGVFGILHTMYKYDSFYYFLLFFIYFLLLIR